MLAKKQLWGNRASTHGQMCSYNAYTIPCRAIRIYVYIYPRGKILCMLERQEERLGNLKLHDFYHFALFGPAPNPPKFLCTAQAHRGRHKLMSSIWKIEPGPGYARVTQCERSSENFVALYNDNYRLQPFTFREVSLCVCQRWPLDSVPCRGRYWSVLTLWSYRRFSTVHHPASHARDMLQDPRMSSDQGLLVALTSSAEHNASNLWGDRKAWRLRTRTRVPTVRPCKPKSRAGTLKLW